MSDALEEHGGKLSKGGRNMTNLQLVDDINALAMEEQKLEALVECFDKHCTRYQMEISAEKTKLITSSFNGRQWEIKVKGPKQARYRNKLQILQMMSQNRRSSQELCKPLQSLNN